MTENIRLLKVFLSYASQDKVLVRELSRNLASEGWIDPWIDEKKLLLGQDWRIKIEEAVETSDIVIVCLSSNSVNKEGFVQKEVRYAKEIALEKPDETIFLIPVRIDDCEIPRSLRFFQWCDYFGEKKDENYSLLLQSLKLCYQQKLMREEYIRASQEKDKLQTVDVKEVESNITDITSSETAIREKILQEEKELLNKKENKHKEKELGENRASPNILLSSSRNNFYIRIGGGTIIIFVAYWLYSLIFSTSPFSQNLGSNITTTPRPSESTTITSITSSPTATQTATPTPMPTEINDVKGVSMRLIPAGEFTMGGGVDDALADCPNCERNFFMDAEPPHKVYLYSFYIDKYEVTNTLYKFCVDEGVCEIPQDISSSTHSRYYGNTRFDNYPVINVTWYQADVYCKWRNARLPTEAEWEKASRGTDGRTYPWGNNSPDSDLLNYNNWDGDTTEVGIYEKGKSIYGLYDMGGNVAEWVADWYDPLYYKTLNELVYDPKGPANGTNRVTRGGSFGFFWFTVRSTFRINRAPNLGMFDTGFRCASN